MSERSDKLPIPEALASLVELSPTPLWLAEQDGARSYFNPAWYQLTGGRPDSELGWGWLERVHDEDRERVHRAIRTGCGTGRPFRTLYRLACSQEQWRTLEEHGYPELRTGSVASWRGSSRDTTREREEHNRYREFTALLANVVQERDLELALATLLRGFDVAERRGALCQRVGEGELRLLAAPGLPGLTLDELNGPLLEAARKQRSVVVAEFEGATQLQLRDNFAPRAVWVLPVPGVPSVIFTAFLVKPHGTSDDQLELLAPWTSLASLLLRSGGIHA